MKLLIKITPYFFIFWIGRAFVKAIKAMFQQEGLLMQILNCTSIQVLGTLLALVLFFKMAQYTTRAFLDYKLKKFRNKQAHG